MNLKKCPQNKAETMPALQVFRSLPLLVRLIARASTGPTNPEIIALNRVERRVALAHVASQWSAISGPPDRDYGSPVH
jgi:hypothetical protein